MHLAREADTGNFFRLPVGVRKSLSDGDARRAPPVFRVLLGPADLWSSKGLVFFRGRRNDAAGIVDNQGAGSPRANVNSQDVDRPSSTKSCSREILGERLSHFVGHKEERFVVKTGELRTQARRVVLLFDIDDLFRSRDGLQRNVVIVAVLEHH